MRTKDEFTENNCLRGVFLHHSLLPSDYSVIELDGVAAPGTSGSPVFDERGHVWGIIFAGLDNIKKDPGAMSTLAIPVHNLVSLIRWESKRKPGDSIYVWSEFIEDVTSDSEEDETSDCDEAKKIHGVKNLLSQVQHKGLWSSSTIGSANICGVGTSLCKSSLLPPWSPSNQHVQTLPHSAPLTRSLQSGNSRLKPCYDEGNSSGQYRVKDLVLRLPRHTPKCHKVLKGEAAQRSWMQKAAAGVRISIVCLSLLKDGEASAVFSGTVVRSDGIVATSADCLKHLKGTKHKISVKILGDSDTYEGVLLHTDFPSKIAFVKILFRKQLRLRVPKWGKLGSRRKGDQVVGAGCKLGCSIDDKEKTESHNAWTSGRLIKASCGIGKPGNGGALVSLNGEVLGVIQDVRNWQIEATPIEDVLKYLEYSEKHGEHAEDM